jgi:hypothetical protein
MKTLRSTLVGLALLLGFNGPASAQLIASLINRPDKGEDPAHFAARQVWECAGVLSTTADFESDVIGDKFTENSKIVAAEAESYAELLSKKAGVSRADGMEAAHKGAIMVTRAAADSNTHRIEYFRKQCVSRISKIGKENGDAPFR